MSNDRDWEKELAMIDRQLAELSDEKLAATANAPAQPAAAGAAQPTRGAARAAAPAAPAARGGLPAASPSVAPVTVGAVPPGRRWLLYVRLLAAVALAVGVVIWPYGWRCGEELFLYLGLVGATVLAGAWSAVWSWRHRAARSHVLSLLVVLLGLGVGAWQTLPRVGLALPSMDRPAMWTCQ